MAIYNFLGGQLPKAREYLNGYEDFIAKNASAVSQIESGLRSLTYIIPGRFRESEIASESLHSGVQLLSLYHDSLLARAIARLPAVQRPQPSHHNRYTRFWTQKSPFYRRVALLLQMIQHTELLWEMAAKRRGEKMRWRVVVILEFAKAVCRLLLLRLTNRRPLLSPPLPEREFDPASLDNDEPAPSGLDYGEMSSEEGGEGDNTIGTGSISSDVSEPWTMPRTGLSIPALPDSGDISNYLLSKVLTADDIKPPKALLHRVNGLGEVAEVMYILRPVAYALAMQQWCAKGNKKNWTPWLLGFSIEYGARQLAKKDIRERISGGLRGVTALEKEELRKRGWALGWWVMRGAFYENVTKAWIHAITRKLSDKPLLGIVGGVIEDYEYLWNEYYFPTATL